MWHKKACTACLFLSQIVLHKLKGTYHIIQISMFLGICLIVSFETFAVLKCPKTTLIHVYSPLLKHCSAPWMKTGHSEWPALTWSNTFASLWVVGASDHWQFRNYVADLHIDNPHPKRHGCPRTTVRQKKRWATLGSESGDWVCHLPPSQPARSSCLGASIPELPLALH